VILRNTRSPDVLPPRRRTPNAQPPFRRGSTKDDITPDSGTSSPTHQDPEPVKGGFLLEPSTVLRAPGTGHVVTPIRDRLVHILREFSSFMSPDSHQSDLLRRTTWNITKAILLEPTRADLDRMNTRGGTLQNAVDWLCDSILTNITAIIEKRLAHQHLLPEDSTILRQLSLSAARTFQDRSWASGVDRRRHIAKVIGLVISEVGAKEYQNIGIPLKCAITVPRA
jgi:hypothetical protein